jgi:hypothetical protein
MSFDSDRTMLKSGTVLSERPYTCMPTYSSGGHFINVLVERELQLLRHRLRAAVPVHAI